MSSAPQSTRADKAGSSTTTFEFQHRVFTMADAVFRLDRTNNQVALHMTIGGVAASMAIGSIQKGFDIEPGSPDAQMLKMVEKGLRFVREIRPGDDVPNEVLDGSASWKVEPHHEQVARSRLLVQLVAWMGGGETAMNDPAEFLSAMEDPAMKEKITAAFEEAAVKLGFGPEGKQKVTDMIDQLTREMSYIEALREKVGAYFVIERKLKMLAHAYKADRTIGESLQRIQILMTGPFTQMRQSFSMVDAQTSEIISALKKLTVIIDFVRSTRDKIRDTVLLWDEIGNLWADLETERGEEAERAIAKTYRFAATNFPLMQRWTTPAG